MAEKERNMYISKDVPYLDKVLDAEGYADLKGVCNRFSTDDRLRESLHDGDTQKNECMNMTLAHLAPKTTNYLQSASLSSRVAINASIQASTNYHYWSNVYQRLGVHVPTKLSAHLQKKDKKKTAAQSYKKTLEYKRRRKHNSNTKMLHEIKEAQVIERDNLGTYKPGAAFDIQPKRKSRTKSTARKGNDACWCGSMLHKRVTHRDCLLNPKDINTTKAIDKTEIHKMLQVCDDHTYKSDGVNLDTEGKT